jgi:IS4 transposase
VSYRDPDTGKRLVILTSNLALPARTVAELYKCRWQIELFFKWIKQNLSIKSFFGTSENAVRTQIWIAVRAYVPIAILKKRLKLDASLSQILQTLSVTSSRKCRCINCLQICRPQMKNANVNQLKLLLD